MRIYRVLSLLRRGLTPLFWILFLFGTDAPDMAFATLLSVAVHEGGHLLALGRLRRSGHLRSRLCGFLLTPQGMLSYEEQIFVALAGPAANLLCAIPLSFWGHLFSREDCLQLAGVGVLCALSNLLPVHGYDGERILTAVLCRHFGIARGETLSHALCFFTVCLICYGAFFVLLRFGEGHWLSLFFLLSLLASLPRDEKMLF